MQSRKQGGQHGQRESKAEAKAAAASQAWQATAGLLMGKLESEERALLAFARASLPDAETQVVLLAMVVQWALERGYSQMIAERMARYVWDTAGDTAGAKLRLDGFGSA